jgi:hypothetical protein
MLRIGSRTQVMHGNAKMTGGGLKKRDLKYNKQGKIVSKKMSQRAKKEKRLQKAGYITKKGQFGAVRRMRGGSLYVDDIYNSDLSTITIFLKTYNLIPKSITSRGTSNKDDSRLKLIKVLENIKTEDNQNITSEEKKILFEYIKNNWVILVNNFKRKTELNYDLDVDNNIDIENTIRVISSKITKIPKNTRTPFV